MNPEITREAVRSHYDRLSLFYRWLWGEHIHHGFWENGETPAEAQSKLIQRLVARAQIPHGARVLDVGCGFGGSAMWLARELDCSVLGITLSPAQAAIAERKVRAAGLSDRARFEVRDANHLDALRPQSFDVVWVVECSEHLPDKARFVRQCAHLLRPHGVLALAAWLAVGSSPSASNRVEEICRGMLCPSLGSMRDYTDWLAESGFEEIIADDVTENVEKTWEIGEAILRRPLVRALLPWMGKQTRQFARTFPLIRQAYATGAMAFGLFTARKYP